MDAQQGSVFPENNGYFIFMGRVTGLWLILAFIVLWITGDLPHQLPADSTSWLPSPLMGQLATVLPSTLTLLFMIIPSRKLALLCLLSMLFLIAGYQGRNPALRVPIFALVYLPFMFGIAQFRNAWKWTYRFMILSFLFIIPTISLSYTAIPVYSFLTNAFIRWEQVFVRFVERFEPK